MTMVALGGELTMKRMLISFAVAMLAAAGFAGCASAQNAYITNSGDNTVSVIATATNTVVGSPIPVGSYPIGVAVTPDGSKVYVTNALDNTVSVIATATNTVTATIPLPPCPGISNVAGVAVALDGSKVYVAGECLNAVAVID